MKNELSLTQLRNALQYKNIHLIRTFVDETPNATIADTIEQLNEYERVFFFRIIKPKDSGEIFSYLEHDIQESIIKSFTDKELEYILDDLYLDDIVDLIEEMPANISQKILSHVKDQEDRNKINKLLKYNDDSVGSVMSVEFIKLNKDITCSKAIEIIRKKREDAEVVHYYIVIDDDNKLAGVTTLEDIVFVDSRRGTYIYEIMEPIQSLNVLETKEHATLIFADHDMSVLPVVNDKNEVLGIVTSDDVIDVLHEEATEDIYKMAGIESEEGISYNKPNIKSIVKSRIFWLIILMLGSTLSQLVIQIFQAQVEGAGSFLSAAISSAIVVSMVPVISGTAGNAGAQAATTVTRALALHEIKGSKWKVISSELRAGAIIGLILFITNFIRLILYFTATGNLLIKAEQIGIILMCLVSSLSMFLAVVFAKFVGAVVPLAANKLKKDPAVMSSPILATLTDATSTIIFFSLAMLIFHIFFH
ncbi:magnesium transporter [Mycoplasma zalophi]|uniref:Magnesium transporter MgtE n=1 Tax=Mycoplasma zalophi TaxID=191287 RepID=A0ABS6DRH8_9MOLU|nr:magnesium transporter [Mycoplasma zalophi]MBU4691247.1 magnesium transporter [Mycoplasma zalophi]MBU4692547.1 magnesium transporter [Mycoplasma zalophi]